MRLFIALDFSQEIKYFLKSFCFGLKNIKWTQLNNFHLTLHFLGEQYGPNYQLIQEGLSNIVVNPFELEISGINFFKSKKKIKTLWLGVSPNQNLDSLQKKIKEQLIDKNISFEDRTFIPHITLGKTQKNFSVEEFASYISNNSTLEKIKIPIKNFHLFSSKQYKQENIYTIEMTYPLEENR